MRISGKTYIASVAATALLVGAPIVSASRGDDGEDRAKGGGTRWALVDETGTIVKQTGGFKTVNCFQANANCYIDVDTDATGKGLAATIAVQNNVAGQPPSLNGEVAVGACGIEQINCAPPNTEFKDVIVVAPRNSDGSTTTPEARKRFYVEVLGKAGR
jgi:hypothetical protein